ncbi:mitochondrial cardiolipin hydrolase isoform X2 [Dendroctonus ponderosae]|uniref:mitochondrial cardiolipin hydrolase isoform X2 n=1 Tax=Dendroctonus ponderosae TaxID=77166 RepID=UPI0020359B43|nr:mitochondrial cardiolipin hydrolase isoform X2 [Dendroctonus ponderosae]KAH1008856.1 hypothetical protein HUJ05_009359 [Dendroctonus ponderosae]
MSNKLNISVFIGIISAPIVLCYFLKKRNFCCKPHLISKQECGYICSYTRLERLLRYIGSAKKSISMCMYMMTLQQIKDALISAARRGVLIRFVIDKVNSRNCHVKLNLDHLSANGVVCLTSPSENEIMHHKFCLIDEKDPQAAKAFFGSVNLTAQAFCQNFEALILTNNQDIIERLSAEFEQLWTGFHCNSVCHYNSVKA